MDPCPGEAVLGSLRVGEFQVEYPNILTTKLSPPGLRSVVAAIHCRLSKTPMAKASHVEVLVLGLISPMFLDPGRFRVSHKEDFLVRGPLINMFLRSQQSRCVFRSCFVSISMSLILDSFASSPIETLAFRPHIFSFSHNVWAMKLNLVTPPPGTFESRRFLLG